MDPYRLLLESIGIYDHDIPVDVVPEELPEEYFEEYWSDKDALNSDFHLDYDQEVDYHMNCKKLHRYSRKARFKFILFQLLGMSGTTPREVVRTVRRSLGKVVKTSRIWNRTRAILKKHRLRKYYNRIPQIIKLVSQKKPVGITSVKIQAILDDFFNLDYQFNNKLRGEWDRKYFPNLRFIALKLISKYDIHYPYHVPLIRTSRKKKYLENLFSQFLI